MIQNHLLSDPNIRKKRRKKNDWQFDVFPKCKARHYTSNAGRPLTVTASFKSDSPNTTMYSISLTWISSKTASTATGSTAAINDANKKMSSTWICLPNKFNKLQAYKEEPAENGIEKRNVYCRSLILDGNRMLLSSEHTNSSNIEYCTDHSHQ